MILTPTTPARTWEDSVRLPSVSGFAPRLESNQEHEALLRAHLLNRWPTPATVPVA